MSQMTECQIIRRVQDDAYLRILWISPSEDLLYWIRVDSTKNIPVKASISAIQGGIGSGVYEYAADRWLPRATTEDATASSVQHRDKAWGLIKDIVRQEPDIYLPSRRSTMLEAVQHETGVFQTNLYKYLGQYWRGGKVPDAFLSRPEDRARNRNYYSGTGKRIGRRKVDGANGKKLTEKDLANFDAAIRKYYLTKDKLTLEQVYQRLLADSYSIRNKEGELESAFGPDETPSKSQFLYWHNRTRNARKEMAARDGSRNYSLRHRGGTGNTSSSVLGPGMLAQIDATTADIFLVRQDDRGAIVGRPTMYFVMDAMSHIVMGMHVSLDPPSLESASIALINASEDKVEYCRKYGISITPSQWPCSVLPASLLADRGELEGKSADILVNKLNITLQNDPPYRGDLKGIIESHFHTINTDIRGLPGWMGRDYGERCTDDYRLDARLDIRQFVQVIIECVLCYNNYHYMDAYTKTLHMRRMHVRPIPLELWEYGMKYLTGGIRTLGKEYIRYSILPHGEASICRNGILFKKMVYSCPEAEEEKWFDTARIDGRTRITVAYDPRNAAHIYFSLNPDRIIECSLVEHNGMLGDFHIREVEQMNEADNAEWKRYEPTERLERNKSEERIKKICDDAQKSAPDTTGMSHAGRIKDIAKNLEKEKQAQYVEETKTVLSADTGRDAGTGRDIPVQAGQGTGTADPYGQLLDELLEEALSNPAGKG